MRYTFKVYERLKREQHINTLFLTGKAYSVFPLRLIWLAVPRHDEKEPPAKVGFSVPKKKFRSSVDRHRVRRLIAEAWRLNKHTLYEAIPPNKQLHLFFVFTGKEMPDHEEVTRAVLKGIKGLSPALSQGEGEVEKGT